MKILAVDDERYVLEMFPLLAAQVGYSDVATALSGPEALKLLNDPNQKFDCLVFDINMPEMDGIELCRRVRQMSSYRQTPIIILTALSDKRYVDQAFQAGATDYLTKPFDLTELGVRLRLADEIIGARREAQATRRSNGEPSLWQTEPTRPRLEYTLNLSGSPRLTDPTTLRNYLTQLSRSGASVSQIAAVGIDDVEELHRRATADEFSYVLQEVAAAIDTVLAPSIALMSYLGAGRFLFVSNAAARLDAEETENAIQYILDERNLEYDDGTPMNCQVSVGSSIQPLSGSPGDIDSAIERALARETARTAARRSAPARPNIR